MGQVIDINQGEIKVKFTSPTSGKVSFSDLGITDDQLSMEGGFLRMVFDMENIGEHDYYSVPTVEIAYTEKCPDTLWQCEFNGTTILDKHDHNGNSTVLLLDRRKLESLEHHHENQLIIHAEFPESVHLSASGSYVHFFK